MTETTMLEDELSRPSAALLADMKALDGDILVLGAGGKLGPNIVRMALRASEEIPGRRVFAASRFSDRAKLDKLREAGAEAIVCDLADENALAQLPEAENVVFLVSARFGMTDQESQMWFMNTYLPGRIIERFRASRIVALSTGNVYPPVPLTGAGADEDTAPMPVGEYGMSCLGRERIMSRFSLQNGTPLAILRLNYAVEMRYGPLVDVARAVNAGEPVSLAMSHLNAVWQGYANEVVLRSLLRASSPPFLLNVAGPETLSVRRLAERFAVLFGKEVDFVGVEGDSALLSDAGRCHALFGYPDKALGTIIEETAQWISESRPLFAHASGFQKRDGKF